MLTSHQLAEFYPDLADERLVSGLALVHSRFSTNTFPSLAAGPPLPVHGPQRRDQHPGRQPQLDAGPRGAVRHRPDPRDLDRAFPVVHARAPATRPRFDEVLELLHLGGPARSTTPC